MIARIEGNLVKLNSDCCLIQFRHLGYEVMLPSYCISALSSSVGSNITLWTMEYYEGTPAGGNLIPRLVGFLNPSERDFFTKYTSVKGIGIRKGLRSLSVPIATIAAAIETSDEKLLLSMPGIGKRMAQHIIAELKGKLQSFAADAEAAGKIQPLFKPFQAEALEILIAWGEKRPEVMEFIELACKKHPDISTAEALVPLVYRLKQGIEV
ncbi:MAG: Holliday junction branch migration protein RuvA [Planctomycetota bacterium]|jgi:Holliday junction DNA helicase RuvA